MRGKYNKYSIHDRKPGSNWCIAAGEWGVRSFDSQHGYAGE